MAEWLIELARQDVRYIAGIDHGFSFPQSCMVTDQMHLKSPLELLESGRGCCLEGELEVMT